MELTDITKEKERKMQKNEKQVIAVLAAAIAVVAVILIAMLVTSRDTTDNEGASTSLKNAVQEETNNKKNNEGKDVGDGNVADSTDDNITEASDSDTKSASEIMDADDGYVFPDADTEYISKSDIKKLSDSELQYAVNEIYARHGLKFTKKVNKERFEKKAWYNGTVDDQDSISLNKYEKKNVDTMAAELKKRGLR